MKLIPLSQHSKNKLLNLSVAIDDEDFERVNKYTWNARWAEGVRAYYAVSFTKDEEGKLKTIYLHRFLMDASASELVDHADGITLNCQKYNLRKCNRSQNGANRKAKKDGTSKYLGVCFDKSKNRFRAQITVNKQTYALGTFTNNPQGEIEAAQAYDIAALKYHKEFSRLNFK